MLNHLLNWEEGGARCMKGILIYPRPQAWPQAEIRSNKLKGQKGFYTRTFKDQRSFDLKQLKMLQLCYIVLQRPSIVLVLIIIDWFDHRQQLYNKKKKQYSTTLIQDWGV